MLLGLAHLACPECKSGLAATEDQVTCVGCGRNFPVLDNIPDFISSSVPPEVLNFYEMQAAELQAVGVKPLTVGYRSGSSQIAIAKATASLIGDPRSGLRILDVGCGHGLLSSAYVRTGNQVTGIDVSIGLLKFARGAGLDVYRADARKLPFSAEQFDVVLALEIIQHLDDASEFISELLRVTRPSGFVVVTGPNSESGIRRALGLLRACGLRREYWPETGLRGRRFEEYVHAAEAAAGKITGVLGLVFPFPFAPLNSINGTVSRLLATNFVFRIERRT